MPDAPAGRLVVQRSDSIGRVYLLERDVTSLGRGEDCDIVIEDPYASRRHAEIARDADGYLLRDLGSRNGTFVNGQRLEGVHRVRPGDRIAIGGWTLRLQNADETLVMEQPAQGSLAVDVDRAEVWLQGRRIELTAKEFLALRLLYEKAGALCDKEELAQRVWPEYQGGVGDYNIEQLISRLRRKLGDDAQSPRWLLTVRGLGYRLLTD